MHKPSLTIIQSTHASLDGLNQTGLLARHRKLLSEYAKTFNVVVYSSDTKNYSDELGVQHHGVPWIPQAFGWRHLVFFLWLVWQARHMKGVIKVFGSNIPTLPLVKLLSRCPMMVTYQFDYAENTRRSERLHFRHWLALAMEKLALGPADLVLVTTTLLEKKVREVHHKKTVFLPNWVDLDAVEHLDIKTSRCDDMILYAGRLHPIKGIDILIRAFAAIRQQYPNVKLVICGVGQEREKLNSLVESLELEGVEFRGALPNSQVLQLMNKATIFVLPTMTMEGHPKALIEAMSCGATCIASDVPGNQHVIRDGKTGLLVPPANVEFLAQAIKCLLDDATLRQRLSTSAQVDAATFSFASIVPKEIQTLYSMVGVERT